MRRVGPYVVLEPYALGALEAYRAADAITGMPALLVRWEQPGSFSPLTHRRAGVAEGVQAIEYAGLRWLVENLPFKASPVPDVLEPALVERWWSQGLALLAWLEAVGSPPPALSRAQLWIQPGGDLHLVGVTWLLSQQPAVPTLAKLLLELLAGSGAAPLREQLELQVRREKDERWSRFGWSEPFKLEPNPQRMAAPSPEPPLPEEPEEVEGVPAPEPPAKEVGTAAGLAADPLPIPARRPAIRIGFGPEQPSRQGEATPRLDRTPAGERASRLEVPVRDAMGQRAERVQVSSTPSSPERIRIGFEEDHSWRKVQLPQPARVRPLLWPLYLLVLAALLATGAFLHFRTAPASFPPCCSLQVSTAGPAQLVVLSAPATSGLQAGRVLANLPGTVRLPDVPGQYRFAVQQGGQLIKRLRISLPSPPLRFVLSAPSQPPVP
jgi:hypothetical protein